MLESHYQICNMRLESRSSAYNDSVDIGRVRQDTFQ